MQKRTLKVALLAVLAVVLVLGMSGGALAATWTDLPATVTAKYGITNNQVAAISEGFGNNLWKPQQDITRAQFTKMAVAAFEITLANPATPSFADVPRTNHFFMYIEGAKAAGIVNGLTATTFGPNDKITRQQAVAIVARYVAAKSGDDLATMYTPAQLDGLLGHFGDRASISANLRNEVAYAFEKGLTKGNALGNFAPLANLWRIQAAAFLIRAQELVPPVTYTPAKIELVSADNTENLIGQPRQVTFKVTDAAGHPAKGVLVDFDVLTGALFRGYVGNVQPEAARTNSRGEVTVNVLSTEPGIQRLSAAVSGLPAERTTVYWVVLDEVYIRDLDLEALNNAGQAHEWSARVVVFGPGPRSTSALDWYNAIDATYDPANVNEGDGINVGGGWSFETEMDLPSGYAPRTLAGIDVEWAILNIRDDDPRTPADETIPSVGDIVKVDGTTVTARKAAVGKTNAAGISTITINSTATGDNLVEAVADYAGNPYPEQLYHHLFYGEGENGYFGFWSGWFDWLDQPAEFATALKTWEPAPIGGGAAGPITPAGAVNNTGELETFTITLTDTFGNPIPGYTVEWWLQGVGFFKSDGPTTWTGVGEQNKDIDVTDPAGKAQVTVQSLVPGQTIIHAKVMDKYGLPYREWNVVKQWYSIDDVRLGIYDLAWRNTDTNPVNVPHTWIAEVSGAKYIYTMYDLNLNGLRDDRVLVGNRDHIRAAAGTLVNMDGTLGAPKAAGVDLAPGAVVRIGGVDYTRLAGIQLAANEFWTNRLGQDAVAEVWAGLPGKTAYFFTNVGSGGTPTSNTALAMLLREGPPWYVGSITSPTSVVTDAMGRATVTINSTVKGTQWTYVVVDYADNPQDGNPLRPLEWFELRWASATKTWTAAAPHSVVVWAGETGPGVVGDRWVNPVDPTVTRLQNGALSSYTVNTETLAVQVFDQFGNALPDYEVRWQIVGQGTVTPGTMPTYHPHAHFAGPEHNGLQTGETAGVGDTQPHVNSNPLWESAAGPFQFDGDDDRAWGWTRDIAVNFTRTLTSAAHVTLVLDETAAELWDRVQDHFTNIVNVKVFTPAGALLQEFNVTKVWTLQDPTLTTLSLEGGFHDTATFGNGNTTPPTGWTYGLGPWTRDNDTTTAWAVRFNAKDQFGNVLDWAALGTPQYLKLRLTSTVPANNRIETLGPGAWMTGAPNYPSGFGAFTGGWAYVYDNLGGGSLAIPGLSLTAPQTVTAQIWLDADNDNVIDATEIKSNVISAEIVE